MTLQEIFKDKPELLKEPAVTFFIEYVRNQHYLLLQKTKKLQDINDRVLIKCLESEAFVIHGVTCHETVEQISNLYID